MYSCRSMYMLVYSCTLMILLDGIRILTTVFLAAAKSWTLELLAFDEYCRFYTSALFLRIKRASIYMDKQRRSIKTAR